MGMEHLYPSRVKVQRQQATVIDGIPTVGLVDRPGLSSVPCRLDLTFVRLGKDAPPIYVAGKAPDRIGTMFCDPKIGLKAGDTIVTVSGPITGTFEIKAVPDIAQGYSLGHHIEVQITESNQDLSGVEPSTLED